MNYKEFAKKWIEEKGLFDKDSDYNGALGEALMKMVELMSEEHHSGFSAMMVNELFYMLNKDYNNPDSKIWKEFWESPEGIALKKEFTGGGND